MTKKKTPAPVKKAVPNIQTESPNITINASDMYALEEQNAALRSLLSKQSEPMPEKSNLPERVTMLTQFVAAFDAQLSRFNNSLNTLDGTLNRLVIQKEDATETKTLQSVDLSTNLNNLLGYFYQYNDRLDILNAKLSDLI